MKNVHSYWAYLVLAILIFAVINAILGLSKKKQFTDKDLRIGLFALIVCSYPIINRFGLVFHVSLV